MRAATRGRAVGIWAAGASLALTAGPLAGGALTGPILERSHAGRHDLSARLDADEEAAHAAMTSARSQLLAPFLYRAEEPKHDESLN